MSYPYLSTFAGNLRLDENELQHILISQYLLDEKYQRVVELWFRKDDEPTWEKLRGAVPPLDLSISSYQGEYRRESSTSMNSVSVTTPLTGKRTFTLREVAKER